MTSRNAHTDKATAPAPAPRPPEGSDPRPDRGPAVVTVRELMTSSEVAGLLQVSQATLCRWRQTGSGPRVLWLSPRVPRYLWRDVEHWMERSRS